MEVTTETSDEVVLRSLVEVMTLLHSARDHDSVLQAVVTGVCEVLGYGMAAIRVMDDDRDVLHTAAVVGPQEAVALMKGRVLPVAELAREFEWADRDEDVYFVPWERLPEDVVSTWVPDVPVGSAPDAWHPMDALYVTLNDREGQLLGVLGVDLPRSGRRPGPRQRKLLQLFARQAALALDRTKMFDQQSRLVASLLERQQESSALVATITHDLRSPLTVIRFNAELARDDIDGTGSEQVVAHLDGIEKAVHRMASTIEELLDQREPRRADAPPTAPGEPVDLAEVVAEIVTVSGVVADRRGLSLELRLDGGDGHVTGDRRQLLRAIDNLVTNALKYTPTGGRVVVSLESRNGEVIVTCADDGVGIPADEQEAVFDEYARAAYAKQSGIEGTGLGLPSARRIITAHGGTLTLESTPGEGSTFVAELPRHRTPT